MVSNIQPLNDSPGVSKRTCSRLLACRGVTETKRAPPRYSTPFKTNGADADEITLAAVFLTGFFRGFATADDDDGASALLRPARRSAICCFSSSHWPDSAPSRCSSTSTRYVTDVICCCNWACCWFTSCRFSASACVNCS